MKLSTKMRHLRATHKPAVIHDLKREALVIRSLPKGHAIRQTVSAKLRNARNA